MKGILVFLFKLGFSGAVQMEIGLGEGFFLNSGFRVKGYGFLLFLCENGLVVRSSRHAGLNPSILKVAFASAAITLVANTLS